MKKITIETEIWLATRDELAERLDISPNRVSELTKMGALQPYSKKPLLYDLGHNMHCFIDYQQWLKNGKPGSGKYAVSELESEEEL